MMWKAGFAAQISLDRHDWQAPVTLTPFPPVCPAEFHESPSRQSAAVAAVWQREEVGTHLRPGEHRSSFTRLLGPTRNGSACTPSGELEPERSAIPQQWGSDAADRRHHPQTAFKVTDSQETVSGLQSGILFRFEVFLCQHWRLGRRWKWSKNTATWYWKWKSVRTSFLSTSDLFPGEEVKSSYFSK